MKTAHAVAGSENKSAYPKVLVIHAPTGHPGIVDVEIPHIEVIDDALTPFILSMDVTGTPDILLDGGAILYFYPIV
jgi:hypothetical protein